MWISYNQRGTYTLIAIISTLLLGITLGILIGWLIWHGETKTETRQGQLQRQERPITVHVTDSTGDVIPDAHTSFDPQVFPFENVYKFDNSTVTTNASVTVGMVDNKLSVGMVEAARKEGQEPNAPQWGIGGSIDFGFNPGIVGLHYDKVWGFSVTEGVQIDKTGGRGMFIINF